MDLKIIEYIYIHFYKLNLLRICEPIAYYFVHYNTLCRYFKVVNGTFFNASGTYL